MICVSLGAPSMRENLAALKASAAYVGACELRVDLLTNHQSHNESLIESVRSFPADARQRVHGVRTVLTLRSEAEGGACALSDADQLSFLGSVITGGWDYIDIELRLAPASGELIRNARKSGAQVICSAHFFDGFPESPSDMLRQLHEYGDIAKLAANCRTSEELEDLLTCMQAVARDRRIVIGMGDVGAITRVAATALGNVLTYCAPVVGTPGISGTAPGQIRCDEMYELYREHTQSADTSIFAIVGDPVAHSRSPQYHNRLFQESGRDAVYVPMRVTDPASLMRVVRSVGIAGLSVTVPHKRSIIEELDAVDEAVRDIGSCNTVLARDAGYVGTNTDAGGFMSPLVIRGLLPDLQEHAHQSHADIERALVIGAGGVARTVVYALCRSGCSVIIANRTDEKARDLAERAESWSVHDGQTVRATSLSRPDLATAAESAQLIVQTTSVGMEPYDDQSPVPAELLRPAHLCYDLVYTPEWTKFLQDADAAGCTCISGKEMFDAQADLQARLFAHAFRPGTH
mgnify:CR=1 FL=1